MGPDETSGATGAASGGADVARPDDLDLDFHKLHYHPRRVANWLDERGTVYPITVEISPTNACNLACSFCAFDYRHEKTVELSLEVMNRLPQDLIEAEDHTLSVHVAGEGEPLLQTYNRVKRFVEACVLNGIRVGVTTNGTDCWATEFVRHCEFIRFSVNSPTEATYRKIHGYDDLGTVMETIRACVAEKKAGKWLCKLGIQMVVIPSNWDQIQKMGDFADGLGVDWVSFKPLSRHPLSKNNAMPISLSPAQLMTTGAQAGATRRCFRARAFARSTQEAPKLKFCYAAPFFAFVASDGGVYHCSRFVGVSEYCFGNVNHQSWVEIMESRARASILRRAEHGGFEGCRHPCRLDDANEYLERLLYPHRHDAFL